MVNLVANLTAKTPFNDLLPLSIGTVTLSEITHPAITWIAPAKGKTDATSKALEKQLNAPFPDPGTTQGPLVWTGPGQAMALGPTLKPIPSAALSDQTSGWACCAVEGAQARDVLARLTPIDLRATAFAKNQVARTLLGHMTCILICRGADQFEVMVFRSMAATAAHELERAIRMLAARG